MQLLFFSEFLGEIVEYYPDDEPNGMRVQIQTGVVICRIS